jgi:hypothetical protein
MLSRKTGRGAEPVAVEGAYRSADPRLPNTQLAALLWIHLPSIRPATDRFSTKFGLGLNALQGAAGLWLQ